MPCAVKSAPKALTPVAASWVSAALCTLGRIANRSCGHCLHTPTASHHRLALPHPMSVLLTPSFHASAPPCSLRSPSVGSFARGRRGGMQLVEPDNPSIDTSPWMRVRPLLLTYRTQPRVAAHASRTARRASRSLSSFCR